jgi:hypothetical protein
VVVLSPEDAALVLKLLKELHLYTIKKKGLTEEFGEDKDYWEASLPEERIKVRDIFCEEIDIIKECVQKNPYGWNEEERSIVSGWTHCVSGTFYVERILKKHAIFIHEGEKGVYGVVGLTDEPEEIFFPEYLPIAAKSVLLPFKGIVIYDGIFSCYPIRFLGGFKKELREIYTKAKYRNEIITSLDSPEVSPAPEEEHSVPQEYKMALSVMLKESEKLRGGKGKPPIFSPMFSLVRGALTAALDAVESPEDFSKIHKDLEKVYRELKKLASITR